MSGMLVASLTFGGGNLPALADDDVTMEGYVSHVSTATLPTEDAATNTETLLDQLVADPAAESLSDTIVETADPASEDVLPVTTDNLSEPAPAAPETAVSEAEASPGENRAVTPPNTKVPITPGVPGDDEENREPLGEGDRAPLPETDTVARSAYQNALAATPAPNPPVPQQCGISVAIVLDMSTSLSNSDVNNSREAARATVNALEGTPSEVGVYYFGTRGHNAIVKTSVATSAGANTVRAAIGTVGRPSSSTNYTNWDEPLQKVRAEGADYDIVLFVTDGQPNRWGEGSSQGGTSRALEEAVNSANLLKGDGTTILGVGVGSGINTSNIAQISGPGSYYTVANYDQLTAFLTGLAQDNCRGTVSVVKQVRANDGALSHAGGWDFTSSTPAPGTITPTVGTTANSNGAVNFDIFHPDADTAVVSFTETQKPGYVLEQQNGFNAICRDNASGVSIPVTNVGDDGWTITVSRTEVVTCSVINQEMVLYEPLTVTKTAAGEIDVLYEWDIAKSAPQDELLIPGGEAATINYSVDVTQLSRSVTNMAMGGTITVTNPNDRPMVATLTDQLASGQQCTITGVTDVDPASPGLQVNVPADGLVLDYDCELAVEPSSLSDTNTVTLTWDRADYPQTQEQFESPDTAGTGTATAVVPFTYELTETNKTVTISDSLLGTTGNWTVTWDADEGEGYVHSHQYSITRTPAIGTCETYDNTATIVETDQSSSQSVNVCSGADLTITKTTVQSFDRSYLWGIEKTDTGTGPYTADPVTGDVTVDYSVTVTPGGFLDSEWVMTGMITVDNPSEWQDVAATVTDEADFGPGAQCEITGVVGDSLIVDADPDADGFQVMIPRDSTMEFTYACTFTQQPDYDGSNTATIEWDADAAHTSSATATNTVDVAEADWDVDPINERITVTDSHFTFLGGWEMGVGDGPQTRTYSLTWNVDEAGSCEAFTNTASLVGSDGLELDSSVEIDACRQAEVTVSKTVNASYDRLYQWGIVKSLPDGDPFGQFVNELGEATYTYDLVVNSTGYLDSGWTMGGLITIENPNDYADVDVTVTDATTLPNATCAVDPGADVDPDTPGVQVTVPASGSLDVAYSCTLTRVAEDDYTGHTNTATVTLMDGTPVSSTSVDVTFDLDEVTDDTVVIMDDKTDPSNPVELGTVSYDDALPWTHSYEVTFEATPDECESYTNRAWVETEGTNPFDTVDIIVCDQEDLSVWKTVNATYDRDYEWQIEKSVDQSRIEVDENGTAIANYTVIATASDPIGTNKTVSGMIRMTNPNTEVGTIEATITEDLDIAGAVCVIGGEDENPEVDGFQVVLDDGEVLELDYECTVPADTDIDQDYTNTVTLTWGIDESVSFTEDVVFNAASVTNDEVTVEDTMPGRDTETIELGTVAVSESPATFTYSEELDVVPGQCVDYTNTATVVETGDASSAAVTVCGGTDLIVDKNVVHSLTRTYLWEIDKTVDSETILTDPETGQATLNYSVVATPVTPDGWTDSGWLMSGEITVTNPNEWLDITATVTDSVDIGGGAVCLVADGENALIAGGETVTFTYSCTFTSQPDYDGTNTATVTWSDQLPTPTSSATGTATIADANWDETPVNDTVTIVDDKTDPANPVELGTATWNPDGTPTEFTYSLNLDGEPGQCLDYVNTAMISQTQQSATQTVSVCDRLPLIVEKDVTASYDRTYLWDITKEAEQTSIEVDSATGEATFSYVVSAIPNGYEDSGWTMSGQITVTNPNDFEPVTVTVTDVSGVGGGAVCTVTDGENITIAESGSQTFDYDCTFDSEPDYENGINTATVISDVGTFTAQADVVFALGTETDRTASVMDDKTDPSNPVSLGSAEWNADGTPIEFTYDLEKIGEPGQCLTYTNTAWLDLEAGEAETSLDTELCVILDLEVEKTVTALHDRNYLWDIEKSVSDTSITVDSATGEATFSYLVQAIPDGYEDSGWDMYGDITVTNPNPFYPVTVTVADLTDIPGTTCTVDDGVDAVIGPDSSETFTYSCDVQFEDEPWYSGTNVASVQAGGEFFTDQVFFDFAIDEETNSTVDVMDDMTDPANPVSLGSAEWNDDGTPIEFTYDLDKIGVPGQCLDYTNTAWLDLAGDDPEASVDTELCVTLELGIDKTAEATFDRTYHWDIEKLVDQTQVMVDEATAQSDFAYVVTAIPDGYTDSDWTMTGMIAVTNPNPFHPVTVTVTDMVDIEDAACTVADGVGATIAPDTTEIFTYSCEFAEEPDYAAINTATVTAGDESFTTEVDLTFDIDTEINRSVDVMDDMANPETATHLGTAEWNEEGTPTEFPYTLTHEGVPGQCVTFTNNAWIDIPAGSEGITDVELCVESPLVMDLEDSVLAEFDREYLWTIDKTVSDTVVGLDSGHNALIHYEVGVNPDGYIDSGHALTGSVTITNSNTFVTPIVTVDSAVSFDEVTCEIASIDLDGDMDGTQVIVPPAGEDGPGTLTLSYSCAGEPDTYTGQATASAAYLDANGTAQVAMSTEDVEYELVTEINKDITVLDDKTKPTGDPVVLGTATWNPDGTSTTFQYTLELVGKPGETLEYTNTAWIKETGQSDEITVQVITDEPLFTAPAQPAPPSKPIAPHLPFTGLDGTRTFLSIGAAITLIGTALILATKRRKEE